MLLFFTILGIFFFGTIIGSFLNVLVDRSDTGENSFKGRSHCDKCERTLSALDLVPIFSYIFLNGKCRYCRKQISLYCPLIEITTGGLFVLSLMWAFTYSSPFLNSTSYILLTSCLLFLVSSLILIFFTDLKFGIIPFKAVLFGIFVTFFFHLIFPVVGVSILNYLLSAIASFFGFLFLFLITRGRGIGFGDVVYAFLMGLILGYPKIILGFYIAFISGAVISLILVGLKKKNMKGGSIPFGPFLVSGTIISLFWGNFVLGMILPYLLR